MSAFHLHPRLQADTHCLTQLPLCRLLLMDDARYPWFILVPQCEGIQEIYQLETGDQQQLWHESAWVGRAAMQAFAGDKLNIGALGNLVPQLHLHHVVRYHGDDAWPAPVWGKGEARRYADEARQRIGERLLAAMACLPEA